MFLSIVSVERGEDKSGFAYKKMGFAPLVFLPNGKQVVATGRARYRVVFGDATRVVNGVDTFIKGDLLFDAGAVGEVVEGQIETFTTKGTYQIEGNTQELNTVTVVAFRGESPAVLAANLAGIAVLDGEDVVQPTKKRTSTVPNALVGA